METTGLTKKSRVILEAIADGHTYEQILANFPAWTYHDIFAAAAEALRVAETTADKSYNDRMTEIRQDHPRAYEKWSDEEDIRLRNLFLANRPVKEIALALQRQSSAIRSRLQKLNLAGPGVETGLGVNTSATRPSMCTLPASSARLDAPPPSDNGRQATPETTAERNHL